MALRARKGSEAFEKRAKPYVICVLHTSGNVQSVLCLAGSGRCREGWRGLKSAFHKLHKRITSTTFTGGSEADWLMMSDLKSTMAENSSSAL